MIRCFALALFALALAGCDAPAGRDVVAGAKPPEFLPLQGPDTFVMIVDPASPPDSWRGAAKQQCGKREFCKVFAWTDPAEAARALPMTDRELEAQAFSYGINRVTGYDEAEWDCSRFTRASKCAAAKGQAQR